MNVGDNVSTSLMRLTGTNQIEARPAISSPLFQPQSLTAKGMPTGSTVDHDSAPARDLRSVVERRFMRMNEAHDRIRTELLCSHAPETE